MFSCLLIGDESLLVQCGDLLRSRGHRIAGVVTSNPAVRAWAAKNDVQTVAWGENLARNLEGIDYDWLFSIANLRIVPKAVWEKAGHGAVNFHDGPLPRFAGLNAPAWAILGGETAFGVTWHEITTGIDEGKIYAQAHFEVSQDDDSLTLNTKCLVAGAESFATLIDDIERGALFGQPQDLTQRSYFSKDRRPDAAGTLLFDRPAEDLSRLHRALSFGAGYANRLVHPKVRHADGLFLLTKFEVVATGETPMTPGSVRSVSEDGVVVATADGDVLIEGVLDHGRRDIRLSEKIRAGDVLPVLSDAEIADLNMAVTEVVRHEDRLTARLRAAEDVKLFDIAETPGRESDFASLGVDVPTSMNIDGRIAVIAAFLLRFSGQERLDMAYAGPKALEYARRFPNYFASGVPLAVELPAQSTIATFSADVAARLGVARDQGSYLSDLTWRVPGLMAPTLTVGIIETDGIVDATGIPGCAMTFILDATRGADRLVYDRTRLSDVVATQYARLIGLIAAAFTQGDSPIADLPLMPADEMDMVLHQWNATGKDYDRNVCVHTLIERQAARTPDDAALAWRNEHITYRDLDERSNRIAHALVGLGVRPDTMVGLNMPRCIDLAVGALAIQKAGGAYVPLDPNFPADRLTYMVEDSGTPVILSSRTLATTLSMPGVRTVFVEDLLSQSFPSTSPAVDVSSSHLAYVIYTSGSTGLPKGVMVEHRNVVNFFAGMDERIDHDTSSQPVWLAVTSLSFDISVLELFWTLARGFKVVIHAAQTQEHKSSAALKGRSNPSKPPLDFGLFYWGNDDGAGPAKYQLLLEGAKFADANGFQAIWTPERHFHAFGGPYPNPAVTGAAVAALTKNLSIRAGSCVLPLHHPARVAEEWAVLDNISNGRVALAFASGWMPEDFVLRPENAPPHNKAALLRDLETVRKLWRGEPVAFDFGNGSTEIVTQPRPVQAELPVWLTTAGNPETYREAARHGANILTHLLGQSIEELAEKIRIYRETLVECGRDPAAYKVTLMLHTLLGEDREEVRNAARAPMKEYLRSAAALIKQYAWAFPAFKKPQGASNAMDIDLQSLAADEMDAILEFAFLRYFEDSGLFGTVDDAMRRINQIDAIGVDEVACLIDFGVPSDLVLERLVPLARVVAIAREPAAAVAVEVDNSFEEDIRRHNVTHLQCTPSMARMFLISDADRHEFANIRHLFIGGEALPASLLVDIRKVSQASVENMYGPTETTIWSSTMTADMSENIVPLGKPIANTQLYVLDPLGRPAAPGQPGELYIGGDGVTRGYLNRDALTAERFLPNPFAHGRIYRTGDLVCHTGDGTLRFLGRTDYQVKVRGYRIELGEIEARIGLFPGVAETVVVAREDRADDVRIVAYLRLVRGSLSEDALKQHLRETLPDYMVPSHFVVLETFPLTPNAKVDRKALPKPELEAQAAVAEAFVAPENTIQKDIADAYRRALGIERVGVNDNFFALGGHSLLAVQLHRDIKAGFAPDLTITDIFRFPTVGTLAAFLSNRDNVDTQLSKVAERAALRRAALVNRRGAFDRART